MPAVFWLLYLCVSASFRVCCVRCFCCLVALWFPAWSGSAVVGGLARAVGHFYSPDGEFLFPLGRFLGFHDAFHDGQRQGGVLCAVADSHLSAALGVHRRVGQFVGQQLDGLGVVPPAAGADADQVVAQVGVFGGPVVLAAGGMLGLHVDAHCGHGPLLVFVGR